MDKRTELLAQLRSLECALAALSPAWSALIPDDAPAGEPCGWFADMGNSATMPGRPAAIARSAGSATVELAAGSVR